MSSIYVIVFKTFRLQCVHTCTYLGLDPAGGYYPDSLRLQKFLLWRAFSKVCCYSVRFRRIRVDERRIRNKMFADFKRIQIRVDRHGALRGQCHRFLSNSNPRKFCPKLKKNECKHKKSNNRHKKHVQKCGWARLRQD